MLVTGTRIALDTSQAIAVLNNTGDTGVWVTGFSEVCLPVPVIGELRYGALNSRRAADNLTRIDRLVDRCRVFDVNAVTADTYARVRVQLKRAGHPIPENDVWIAALCIQHAVSLATSDQHFNAVEELKVVAR